MKKYFFIISFISIAVLLSCSTEKTKKPHNVFKINTQTIDSLLRIPQKLLIVNFTSGKMSTCLKFDSVFTTFADTISDSIKSGINFYSIDLKNNKNKFNKYKIKTLPHLLFLKNNKILQETKGALTPKELLYLINKYSNNSLIK